MSYVQEVDMGFHLLYHILYNHILFWIIDACSLVKGLRSFVTMVTNITITSPEMGRSRSSKENFIFLGLIYFSNHVSTLAETTLMMQLGCNFILVGSGVFKSSD